ncbi:hypothetical protein BJV77DRAFT_121534 [Russula vinacea]|nr:hypothetical protein BJV77DRAFT_121534 [Russula vinacea]
MRGILSLAMPIGDEERTRQDTIGHGPRRNCIHFSWKLIVLEPNGPKREYGCRLAVKAFLVELEPLRCCKHGADEACDVNHTRKMGNGRGIRLRGRCEVAILFILRMTNGATRYGLIRPGRGKTNENFARPVAQPFGREYLIWERGRSDWVPEERN